MNERNLCHEAGCRALCCANIYGYMPGRAEFFLKAFPTAQKIENGDVHNLKMKIKNRETGVYYIEQQGWIYFGISGECPNLGSDANCKIHGERFYPRPCINMEPGGRSCFESREISTINKKVINKLDSQ